MFGVANPNIIRLYKLSSILNAIMNITSQGNVPRVDIYPCISIEFLIITI